MSEVQRAFPARLKGLREDQQLTQQALGEMVGSGKVPISRYESGSVLPSVETLAKLAGALNCSADYLLGRSELPREERASETPLRPMESALLDALHAADFLRALQLVGMLLADATRDSDYRWVKYVVTREGDELPRRRRRELKPRDTGTDPHQE